MPRQAKPVRQKKKKKIGSFWDREDRHHRKTRCKYPTFVGRKKIVRQFQYTVENGKYLCIPVDKPVQSSLLSQRYLSFLICCQLQVRERESDVGQSKLLLAFGGSWRGHRGEKSRRKCKINVWKMEGNSKTMTNYIYIYGHGDENR